MKLKLFPKIALILISLAILPVIIVGWQTYSLNKLHIETNVLELHTNLANSLASRMDYYLTGLAGKTRAFVEALKIQGGITIESLRAFVDSNEEMIALSYVNAAGKEMLKSVNFLYPEERLLKELSKNPVFQSYLEQKDKEWIEPQYGFSFENERPRLTLLFPYNPLQFTHGAFCLKVSLNQLWEELSREGAGISGGGREAFVVDEKGIVIFHRDSALVKNQVSFHKHPIVSEAIQKLSGGSKQYKDEQGRSFIAGYAAVKSAGWAVVIEQPTETAFLPIYETRRRALWIVFFSVFVAAFIAFFFARHLSRPIFSLIEGAKKVAERDFDHIVHPTSHDEVSDLTKTFNEMVKELKRYNDLQVDRIIEEKTKTEAVIFSIADGIVLTSEQGEIQLMNDRAVQIFGLGYEIPLGKHQGAEPERFIGKNFLELMKDLQMKNVLGELLSKPEENLIREVVLSAGDYQQNYQLTSELVHTPRTHRKVGVVTVIHDVTLERQIDQMKENFLHSITHDLRNPLTSILGFLKFLLEGIPGPVNEQQKQMLEIIDRASERLLGMINDILDIAKIEAGKLEIELTPINFVAILNDIKTLYQPLADKKAISLELKIPPKLREELPGVLGEPNQIERVVGNLCANAIKFTPSSGQVTLEMEDFPDRIQVAVSDTGPGIPEEYLQKVFDKFQQVKGQRKGGTGLGLTISKYFVELHKGQIWVESQLGKGSRFVFWIPKGLSRTPSGEIVPPPDLVLTQVGTASQGG